MADYIIVDGKLHIYEPNDDQLMHYGVVGMKWGIRKARKQGVNYAYKSMGQKRYEKKLAKAKIQGASSKKIAKTKSKLEMYKTRDKNRQSYASKTTTGKSIAKGILMGPFGAGNYNRMRAAGYGRISSALVSNWITGTGVGTIISKMAENNAARRENEARKKR